MHSTSENFVNIERLSNLAQETKHLKQSR